MARIYGNHRHRRHDNRKRPSIRQIRSLGKFEGDSILSLVAYDWAMDTSDFESSEGQGWYGKVDGPFTNEELRGDFNLLGYVDNNKLNRAERREFRRYKGFIVHESDQGFVYVEFYHTRKELNNKWKEINKLFDSQDETD